MEKKYICSCSFGKDSLAMLLRLIKEKRQIDEVIFYDTGMEFESIYHNRNKIKTLLSANKINNKKKIKILMQEIDKTCFKGTYIYEIRITNRGIKNFYKTAKTLVLKLAKYKHTVIYITDTVRYWNALSSIKKE